MNYLLNVVIFFPALAALLLFMLQGANKSESKRVFAILVAGLELFFVALLWSEFNTAYSGIQFYHELIPSFGISYNVGVDGISLFLLALNALLTFLVLCFFKYIKSSLIIAIFFLESLVMGVFSALDALLFYVFWELTLLPVLFIIGVWGGENRIYASIKYFIYAFGSSLFMLLGILYFAYMYYLNFGFWSFNVLYWYQLRLSIDVQQWLFIAFMLAIAVKIPLFPLHSWQPHAYTQAHTAGSVLLAGVLSKMGAYALLRFVLPLFPDSSTHFSSAIALICVFMVVYGAMIAYVQQNIKTLIAYASLSHMGIIVLGIFSLNAEGLSGAVFFMVSHGVLVGALFMLVGVMYDRLQTHEIRAFGGLAHNMPNFSTIFGIVMMASLGLPLTMGFVGEVLCLYGYFQLNPLIAFLAGSSFFVGAIYMLVMFKKVFYGAALVQYSHLKDLKLREKLVFAPIVVLIVGLGVYPKFLLDPIGASAQTLEATITQKLSNHQDTIDNSQPFYPSENIPQDFNDEEILIIPKIGD